MSAVISGNGLGLFNSSYTQIGARSAEDARLGQWGDSQFVNIKTGNLLLQNVDEQLLFRGSLASFARTYNSAGTIGQVGQDGWTTGFERNVQLLSGTFNASGSIMRRAVGDGSYQDFTYVSANTYRSTVGDGAHDTLVWAAGTSTWTYTEGSTRQEEQYADHASATLQGRLTRIRDLKSDGTTPTTWDVVYDASNRVSEIRANDGTTSGVALVFGYDSSSRLAWLATREQQGGTYQSQIWYEYDANGRLSSVTTDLTPSASSNPGARTGNDVWNSTAANNDGNLFKTSYSYEGTSLRISSLTQSDGTTVSYTYQSDGRVKTVTKGDSNTNDADGAGETTAFTYGSSSTTLTDSLGRAWVYAYDSSQRLTSVTGPAVGGQSDVTTFQYNSSGDVTQSKTVRGSTTLSLLDYQYDGNGNLLQQWDGAGNLIKRTYNAANQVLTETMYTGVDTDRTGSGIPTGAMTTNYVYDTQNRVRFIVNAVGEVSEYAYATSGNGIGQQSSVRKYLGASYTGTMSLSALTTWATATQKGQSTLSESTYDVWGRLAQRTDYASVNATNGAGVFDAGTAVTRYTYDSQGLLRQEILLHGAGRTQNGAAQGGSQVTDYVYDGMGRLLSVLTRDWGSTGNDANTVATTYAYIDSAYQIAITSDAGAVTSYVRNAAGRLVSVSETGVVSGATLVRTTQNWYDGAGQLRISQDAGGGRSYFFYDVKGRLEGVVDSTGAGSVNLYDGMDRIVGTRAYAARVTTTGWTSLAGMPATITAVGLVQNDDLDRITGTTFDAAGRVSTVTDGIKVSEYTITTYQYDAAGRLLKITRTDEFEHPSTNRTQRFFYDNAGRRIGALDAAGYLTEFAYDRAGRLATQVSYATVSPSDQLATGTLVQLRPAIDAANDQTTRNYYDGRNQLVGTLDAEGYLTEFVLDDAGNTRAVRRYGTQLAWAANDTLASLRSRAGATNYREARTAYNGLGQRVTETNAEGTVTRYTYDEAGRLAKTEMAQGTTEVRENNRRYNVFDELVGELAGEGSVHLLAGMTEAQLDAVYAQYGVRHSYDVMSRRIESIDAGGNKTWYFYDSASRLTFTVKGMADGGIANAKGEVTENRYNAFGDVSETLAYTGLLTIAVPGDRSSVAGAIQTLSYVAATDSRRQFTYTARGQLASATDAEGARTDYTYDAFGQLKRKVSASGTTAEMSTNYYYDRRGLMFEDIDDQFGSSIRITDREFDAFGRMTFERSHAGGTNNRFTYDRLGRQITSTSVAYGTPEVQTTAYDAHDRIVSTTDAMGNTTTYAYNDANRSLIVTTPEGVIVSTVHNRHGQILTTTDMAGRVLATNAYNHDGQLVSSTNALNQTATNEYDARSLLSATVDASGRRVELYYDAVGRVLQRIQVPFTGEDYLITSYRYDGQGRQLQVTDASGRVVGYNYDREGRLTQLAQDPAGLNYRTTYTYDAQGRQVTMTEGAYTASARTVQYAYDALGRRTSETVDPGAGHLALTTVYGYDKDDNVISRTDATGAVTRFYYLANRLVATVDPLGNVTRQWHDGEGRLVATWTFAQAVDPSLLNASTDVYQLESALAFSDDDVGRFSVYDRDGKERFRIDAGGNVTEMFYDSTGRMAGSRTYVTPASAPQEVRNALFAGTVTPADVIASVTRNDTQDQVVWQVLDAAGRVRYSVDALGNTQEFYYDAAGRVAGSRKYAVPILLTASTRSELNAGTALDDVPALIVGSDAYDIRLFNVYDGAGRLHFTIDAVGSVQEFLQDGAGRLIKTTRHANAVELTTALRSSLLSGQASPTSIALDRDDARDVVEWRVYDAAGRMRYTVDGSGAISERIYDASGLVVASRASTGIIYLDNTPYYASLTAREALDQGIDSSAFSGTYYYDISWYPLRETTYTYDGAGRVVYEVTIASSSEIYSYGTSGAVKKYGYDAAGRVTSETAYGNLITPPYGNSFSGMTKSEIEQALSNQRQYYGDKGSRQTRYVYDQNGQQRYSIDAAGAITEKKYDGIGRLVETREYGQLLPNASSSESALSAQLQAATDFRKTTRDYDQAGRLVSLTDSLSHSELYSYDGAGNLLSYTNRDGNLWTYGYDAAGRRVAETSPQVSVASVDAVGAISSSLRSVVKRTAYDALGNVTSISDDADGPHARVTSFVYDNRGHQIRTIFPDAGVLDASGNLVSSGVQPTVDVTYDSLGRAVMQKDVRGHYSFKAYDNRGLLTYEVDETGGVTRFVHDAFGQTTEVKRYARAISTTAGNVLSESDIQSQLLQGYGDRSITTTYDLRGLKLEVLQSSSDSESPQQAPRTVFKYNAYGEVWREATLLDGDYYGGTYGDLGYGSWAVTLHYYDQVGRERTTIAPEGYITRHGYSAQGELLETTEYAQTIPYWVWQYATEEEPSGIPPAPGNAATGYDRTMRWQYDALGRKVSETTARHWQDGNGASGVRDVATTFAYDNEGHVVVLTQDGQATNTAYDAMGRVVSVKEAERSVVRSDSDALLSANNTTGLAGPTLYSQASPFTRMAYDAFGNVAQVRSFANGLAAGATTPVESASDLVHNTRYDWQGRNVWEQDVLGTVYTRKYDEADHVLQSSYRLDGSGGRWSVVKTLYTYDATGRQVTRLTSRERHDANGALGEAYESSERVVYDVFGKIIAKDSRLDPSLQAGDLAAQYEYDQYGNMVRSNAQDGIWREYGYDAAGNQVVERHYALIGNGSGTQGYFVETWNEVDTLGRIVKQRRPDASGPSSERSITTQKYDRWGNVVEVVDALGAKTNYEYNELSQAVKEIQATVEIVDAAGHSTTGRPVNLWSYDALGRLVAAQDGNGHVRHYAFDLNGRQTAVIDATNGAIRMAYDVLGRQVLTEDALGHVTFKNFDKAGKVVAQGDYLTNANGTARSRTVREQYQLDQNGNRLAVTDALNKTSRYDYDSRGKLLRSQSAAGVVMSYGYDSNGNKIRETNALSDPGLVGGTAGRRQVTDREGEVVYLDEQTWDYDYLNRLVDHNDLGGADYDYEYNSATGQFVRQTREGTAGGSNAQGGGSQSQLIQNPDDPGEIPTPPSPPATSETSGDRQYFYYASGMLSEIREVTAGGTNWTRYTYDKSGNRTSEETLTHDANGQVLHLKTVTAYDSHNRISRVLQDDLGAGRRIVDVRYAYDAVGNRRKVEVGTSYNPEGEKPQNSSFEDGNVGWSPAAGSGWSIQNEVPYSGGWSARLEGNTSGYLINDRKVRIDAGRSVTATAMVQQGASNAGAAGARVIIVWYDANKNEIGRSEQSNLVDSGSNGEWHPSTLNATAPAGTVYMSIGAYGFSSDEQLNVDDFDWQFVSETPNNPGFESGSTGWNLGAGWSIRNEVPYSGGWSARLAGHASGDIVNNKQVSVQPGQSVTASVMVQQGASNAGAAGAKVIIVWYDANHVQIGRSEGNLVDSGSNGEWHASTVTANAPAGAAYMSIGASGYSNDEQLNVDDFQWQYVPFATDPQLEVDQAYWYAYDAENRVTVSNGQLVNGEIVVADDDVSFALGYDLAGQATQRRYYEDGTLKEQFTHYDQRGQRDSVSKAQTVGGTPTTVVAETFSYDAVGRQTVHRTYDDAGALKHLDSTLYDDDGRVNWVASFGKSVDNTGYNQFPEGEGLALLSKVTYFDPGSTTHAGAPGYDAANRLQGYSYYVVRNEQGTGATTDTPAGYVHYYAYQYAGRDSYLETQVAGSSTNSNFKASTSHSTYDDWGRRVAIREQTPGARLDDRIRYFSYDEEGNILRRREGTLVNGVFTQDNLAELQTELYTYVNGQTVASGKYDGTVDILGRQTAYDTSTTGASRITVQAGDTLRSIAQRVYGNANLWYVLADANAISDDSELSAGATLNVPNVKVSSNDSTTFKPFNPGEAIGDTSPSLPYITPPPKEHCNALATVLIIVVAVVVTYFTAGAATGAFLSAAQAAGTTAFATAATATAAASLTTLGAVTVGAVAGAAGAAASGLVSSALGVGSFSWRNVAAGAITGAITGGIAQYNAVGQAGSFGKAVTLAGADAAANYVGQKIAGIDTSFSWASIAASAVGSAVAAQVTPAITGKLGITSAFGKAFTQSAVNGIVSAQTRQTLGIGNGVDYATIAADAFGNAIGSAINNVGVRGVQQAQPSDSPPEEMSGFGAFTPNQPGYQGWNNEWVAAGLANSTSSAVAAGSLASYRAPMGSNGLGASRTERIASLNKIFDKYTQVENNVSDQELAALETTYGAELFGKAPVSATNLERVEVRAYDDAASNLANGVGIGIYTTDVQRGARRQIAEDTVRKWNYSAYLNRANAPLAVNTGSRMRAPTEAEINAKINGDALKVFGGVTVLGVTGAASLLSPAVAGALSAYGIYESGQDILDGNYVRGGIGLALSALGGGAVVGDIRAARGVGGVLLKESALAAGEASSFNGVKAAARWDEVVDTSNFTGKVDYGALDALGRPTGIRATITENMIGTGTAANPKIIPPGWSGNGALYNEARGHLLGRQLGGSGDVAENLVTLQQNPANSPIMRGFENQVRGIVEGGQTVEYSSTPIYSGSNLVPRGVTISARGTNGYFLDVTVLNPPGY